MNMVQELIMKILNNIWPMLVVFIVAIGTIRFFYLQTHREKFCLHKEFSYLFAIIYIWLLFEILTMAELNSSGGINLTPFSEILRYEFGSKMFNYSVFGNILIFMPFGYLIGKYVNPKKIWPVLITTLLTSAKIEFILLNLVGGIAGYLLYIGLTAINRHLPDIFKSDLFYNIIWIVVLVLCGIYIFGYWGVIF